jgi:hypothetical protein
VRRTAGCLQLLSAHVLKPLRGLRVTPALLSLQVRVVVLGLDKAGKSSVLNALKPAGARAQRVAPTPAAGAATERLLVRTPHGAFKLVALDVSGDQAHAERLWPPHYGAAQGVVWVVDATDALRAQMAQDALDRRACFDECVRGAGSTPLLRRRLGARARTPHGTGRWRTLTWRARRCWCSSTSQTRPTC